MNEKTFTKNDLQVRIVELEPMRVASVRVISQNPEQEAWQKLRAWAQAKGLLDDIKKHPVYGFNNPSPVTGKKEYGYEFWIRIDPDTEVEGEIEQKDFHGGLFAVTACSSLTAVGQMWIRLWNWVNSDKCKYKWLRNQELEKPHDPLASQDDMVIDLYLPIE